MPPMLKPLSPPFPPHPSGLSQSIGFGCPASCIELALVIYFPYGNVHVSVLFCQIIPQSPFPTEFKGLVSMSVSSCHYCLSKFHIYALIYNICLSLTDLLHFVQQAPVSSTSLELTQMHFFLQLSNIPLSTCLITSLSIHLPMDIQVASSYCKQCCNEHWGMCLLILVSLGCMPSSGITGLYGSSVPSF